MATDFIAVSLSLQIILEDVFSQPNSFLAIILQLPLTEMSSRHLPGGKGYPVREADVTAICEPIV
jgi:hypothetical protein